MRRTLAVILLTLTTAVSAGPRTDSSPLAKAPPSVAPCLSACEKDFAACESRPQATDALCPQSRRICFERCDPAVLHSDTLKGLKRTPDELRYKPFSPQTPLEQCRQVCQDRRAICLGQNAVEACDPATSACYDRCDVKHPAAKKKPQRNKADQAK